MAIRSKKRPDMIAVLAVVIAFGIVATELLQQGSEASASERLEQQQTAGLIGSATIQKR